MTRALWVGSGEQPTAEKCPLRLEVESRLKAWLFMRVGRPLYTLRFGELQKIDRGDIS